jgi:hypothetical protein
MTNRQGPLGRIKSGDQRHKFSAFFDQFSLTTIKIHKCEPTLSSYFGKLRLFNA